LLRDAPEREGRQHSDRAAAAGAPQLHTTAKYLHVARNYLVDTPTPLDDARPVLPKALPPLL
jgi:hypothetical protein